MALPDVGERMIENIVASNDGHVYGRNAAYSTARATSFAVVSASFYSVGQLLSGDYYVSRPFLEFNTSSIPSSATISKVNLKMTCFEDHSTQEFDIQILEHDWSALGTITSANMETFFDDCLAITGSFLWRDTSSGISTNTEYTGGDMTPSYINKSGSTYYSLRSSRDKLNNTPTVDEYAFIYSSRIATVAYRPVLVVEYTLPNPKFFMHLKNRR